MIDNLLMRANAAAIASQSLNSTVVDMVNRSKYKTQRCGCVTDEETGRIVRPRCLEGIRAFNAQAPLSS